MRTKWLEKIMSAFFIVSFVFVCLFCLETAHADSFSEPENVLIINSYHQGFTWTRDETEGIIEILNESSANLSVSVEYMDWKNHPEDENLQFLYKYFKYKYSEEHIDLLIATDDIALSFALSNRQELFSDAPVVFCGVNQKGVDQITAGYGKVTGAIEEIDPSATIDIALDINPALKNVYVLYDNSDSGLSTGELVINRIESLYDGLNAIPMNNFSHEEIISKVSELEDEDIVLVTTYYSDVRGVTVDFENISREISRNSSVPVYHLFDLGLKNGAIGGSLISGRLQGEYAAKLALRILGGEDPDGIAAIKPGTTRNVINYDQLKRFGIPPANIPEYCEIINKPFSFIETYRTLVVGALVVFAIMATFILILLFYIDKMRKMKQELVYLAYHDALTGLPNRLSLFENANDELLTQNGRYSAVLFIDMDNFKYINDTIGHASGDQLIVKTGERLASLLKEGCLLYRLSGDEFIILIKDIGRKEDAEAFASHIIAGFREEFEVSNSVLHVSLSVGIALYPEHSRSIEELIRYADIAMYRAKLSGRDRYVVYDRQMNEAFAERISIEKHLHSALARNEFELYYQPQFDLKLNKVSGFEALLRWKSPELGVISPLKFIRIAEDTQLIIPLGTWVLRNACSFLNRLHKRGLNDITISVNISLLQLLQTDFHNIVVDMLEYFELEPACLELEITETLLIESYEVIGAKLEKLKEYGVRIALDDFGMGYSSLSYLKQLPISTLKIDKSFIDGIYEDENRSLTGYIVALGKSLNMCVVAEGVERQEQLQFLIEHECNKIQGYLFSRPVTENEAIKLLDD